MRMLGCFKMDWAWYMSALCLSAILAFVLFCILPTRTSIAFWDHMSPQSGVLATWVTALATGLLAVGLFQTGLVMRSSARSAEFQLMYKRFSAPDMLYARALFARTYLNNKEEGTFWKNNTLPGWKLLHFLNQIGHLVDERKMDFTDVVLAYSEHVTRIGDEWKEVLGRDYYDGRYAPFLRFYTRIKKTDCYGMFKTELDNYYDGEFWKCEAVLDQK